MKPERWQQLDKLFEAALDTEPSQRRDFLDKVCANDQRLRHDLESLLDAYQRSDDFMSEPAILNYCETESDRNYFLPNEHAGDYTVIRHLASGGMGEVYLAKDTRLNRPVALKLLRSRLSTDEGQIRRFQQEAQAASMLNHPNIITLYETGHIDGRYYIATEFVEGETLRQRMSRAKMSQKEVIDLALQVASALLSAHQAGIFHRDIKPENIMIRTDGYVKVLDFGTAKLTEASGQNRFAHLDANARIDTMPGLIIGTPKYMSPEQVRGQTVDARSDLFSLGVVMYEAAAGRAPFDGNTVADQLVSILEKDPLPIVNQSEPTNNELQRIIYKALSKDRDARYKVADELISELKTLRNKIEHASSNNKSEIKYDLKFVRALLLIGIVASVAIIISFVVYRLPFSSTQNEAIPVTQNVERRLSYYMTTRKPSSNIIKTESFPTSGTISFASGEQMRLHLTASHDGYFYLVNEGPKMVKGMPDYNLLFPSTVSNKGEASVTANQQIQIPEHSWFAFDREEGVEKIWMIWSDQPVPEIETIKGLANAKDKGIIINASHINSVREFLMKHSSIRPIIENDEVNKQIVLKFSPNTLVNLLEVHHK